MTKSKIIPKIIIYYCIVSVLIAVLLINFNVNPLFFSILIGILLLSAAFNRATVIKLKDNKVFILDHYLFVPVVRKKYTLSDIKSVMVKKEKPDSGLGYSDNIFVDIFLGYVIGL